MRVLQSKKIVAISKPRCGSTSMRRMLDPFLDLEAGDISVNVAGERPPFHPHITAPYLEKLLKERGFDLEGYDYITTVRHPVQMLESYYKFFQPDAKSRYKFEDKWTGFGDLDFETWVMTGRLAMNSAWMAMAPDWVSQKDLSPLSFEARGLDRSGRNLIDHVFRLEEPEKLQAWIEEKVGAKVTIKHVNKSTQAPVTKLGTEALEKIRCMMPMESALYAI